MKSPFRLERRLEQPKSLNWIVPLVSVAAALLLGAIVLLFTGKNPLSTYWRILDSAFASGDSIEGTIRAATPLAFTGLCAAITLAAAALRSTMEAAFCLPSAESGMGVVLAQTSLAPVFFIRATNCSSRAV